MRGRREPVRGPAWWAAAGLWLGLAGCFGPAGAAPDAGGEPDSGDPWAGAGGVSGSQPGSGGRAPIGTPPDASTAPPPFDAGVPLSGEQRECLGLDQPICLACHTDPSTNLLVLRPSFAPPPPPELVFTDEDLAACGIDVEPAAGDDAGL